MGFYRKRYTKSTNTDVSIKKKKTYTVDGKTYNSKSLADYHAELKKLKELKLIKSFKLPQVDEVVKSKFHAYKVDINGITFDSINESRFYILLLFKMIKKQIKNYELQKKFVLIPAYKKDGKSVREIAYIADFVVYANNGATYVIDIKGVETDVFKIKHKLFEYVYPSLTLECYRYVTKDKRWYTLKEIKDAKKSKSKTILRKNKKTKKG